MVRKNRKSTVALLGFFMLPTSAKFHMHEPERCSAFKPGQEAFLLQATDENGYPQAVIVTADEGALEWNVGDEGDTQHAEVRKNLPKRFVKGIRRADGTFEGDVPPKGVGLPHWEFIPAGEGGAARLDAINEVQQRIESNKELREKEKAAAKEAKNSAKQSTTAQAA